MTLDHVFDASLWRKIVLGLLLITSRDATADGPIREYRDMRPTIDVVDSVRVLSADKARELEDEIKATYAKLSPTVVRIWQHDDQGRAFDENGIAVAGGVSGVIIDRTGLILTCSHHGLAP